MKKTIIGITSGLVALGATGAPELVEMNKEYSIEQVQEKIKDKDYKKSMNSEILEKVYFPRKGLIVGNRKFDTENGEVEILSKIIKDGNLKVEVLFNGKKEKITFVNPPIKVPNGKKILQIDEFGNETEIDEFEINPSEALKKIIVQALELK